MGALGFPELIVATIIWGPGVFVGHIAARRGQSALRYTIIGCLMGPLAFALLLIMPPAQPSPPPKEP